MKKERKKNKGNDRVTNLVIVQGFGHREGVLRLG